MRNLATTRLATGRGTQPDASRRTPRRTTGALRVRRPWVASWVQCEQPQQRASRAARTWRTWRTWRAWLLVAWMLLAAATYLAHMLSAALQR